MTSKAQSSPSLNSDTPDLPDEAGLESGSEPNAEPEPGVRTPEGLPDLAGMLIDDANEPAEFVEHRNYRLRKMPKSDTFWRVHPSYRATVRMVASQDGIDEDYVVHERVWKAVPELRSRAAKAKICDLYLAVSLQGEYFVWFVQRHDGAGKPSAAVTTRMDAVERAQKEWVQAYWDGSSGYRIRTPVDPQPEPEWIDEAWTEILQKAFKDALIDALDHPFVKKIRGER